MFAEAHSSARHSDRLHRNWKKRVIHQLRTSLSRNVRRAVVVGAAATVATSALAAGPASADSAAKGASGPSTTAAPYVVPVAKKVAITSLLTVGDKPAGDGARMVGVPDGLGSPRGWRAITGRRARSSARGRSTPTLSRSSRGTTSSSRPAGQLRIYTGTKQKTGNPVEKAGLTNGTLHVMDAVDESVTTDAQFRAKFGKNTPTPVTFGADEQIDWTKNGVTQNTEAQTKGLSLNRIEDGAFDPKHPNDYYFITTEGGDKAANPAEPTTPPGRRRPVEAVVQGHRQARTRRHLDPASGRL